MARGMLFRAGFTVLIVVIVLVHEACSGNDSYHHSCPPSSCGNIQNISYPFRLKGDPPICGDQRYNLSCENNQTVLYLYAGKYYVQEINYSSYTIRVVDPGIQKDNFSSISRYFLNYYNFSSGDPYTLSYPDNIYVRCNSRRDQQIAVKNLLYDVPMAVTGVVWIKCEKPMISYGYLDTSSCLSNEVNSSNSSLFHSKSYRYVLFSYSTSLRGLGDSCQIEQMFPTAWPEAHPTNCSDLYHQVAYGFQLSWVQVLCDNFTGDDFCYLDDGNFRFQFDWYWHFQCNTPELSGMILSAPLWAKPARFLLLSLLSKSFIPFRESIFHINTSSFPCLDNVGRYNHPLLGPSVLTGDPYGLVHAPPSQAGLWL
ncbi:uncharacterized protein LOC132174102 [Corylus avellana]|uniref:uncharacterized protein LOC132174102 n=1 Tax=Corylus avellana TaxID=13451 RepID=UPI00286B1A71|nr:uncharacterized protein LOC132174102 [Corylus avellana]